MIRKLKSATVINPERDNGRTTFQNTRNSLAPSIRAASNISRGSVRKNCRSKKIARLAENDSVMNEAKIAEIEL